MANVQLVFYGTHKSETDQCELICFVNDKNEITIEIKENGIEYISLDKSTAIKFAKTLRTEINKL